MKIVFRMLGRHTDKFLGATGPIEFYLAIDLGINRVITANPHVLAWMDSCPTLSYDDASGCHYLAVISLDPKHLGIAIPTVFGASDSFFMGHFISSAFSAKLKKLRDDLVNLDQCSHLAMTVQYSVAFSSLLLKD
jgi:hypothetical protein